MAAPIKQLKKKLGTYQQVLASSARKPPSIGNQLGNEPRNRLGNETIQTISESIETLLTKNHEMKLYLLLWAVCVAAALERVNDYNFDKMVIKAPGYVLVDFYADWCRHCQNLMPTIEKLADYYEGEEALKIYKLNGGERSGRKMVKKYEIDGFPMLALFHGTDKPIYYEGGRDFTSINNFLQLATGIKKEQVEIKEAPKILESEAKSINDNNLSEAVLNSPKKLLVFVVGEWCKHCKEIKPLIPRLHQIFARDPSVQIAIVDLAQDGSTDKFRTQFNVKTIPQILWFDPERIDPDGLKRPIPYTGSHDLKSYLDFVNTNAKLSRKIDGGLDGTAGRVQEIEDLIQLIDGTNDDAVLEKVRKIEGHEYYVKLLANQDIIEPELERLQGLVKFFRDISGHQQDGIVRRLNILSFLNSR